MGFFDDVTVVVALLQREGRLTYRALQKAYGFDAELLDDLRRELIFRRIAVDDQGAGLVWTGVVPLAGQPSGVMSHTPSAPSPVDLLPLKLGFEASSAIEDQPRETPLSLAATPFDTSARPYEAPSPAPETMSPAVQQEPISMASSDHTLHSSAYAMPNAEYRQLTVMFCDLVGSTDLSGHLDPEDLREVVRAYQETAAKIIEHYDGHIAQYLGDGLLIYFGYPAAHEDDAQRAVYTGLRIPEAIATLNTQLAAAYKVQLAVRIGIHTGAVVIGEMGGVDRRENLALGAVPTIAARLEGLAQPNTAVISLVTAQLVQRSFVLQEHGSLKLEGAAESMPLFTVVTTREAEPDDHETAGGFGLNALVGRDEEMGLLLRCWEQSKSGLGQVVLLSGDAGLGKSRLVDELRVSARQEGLSRMTFRCAPYTQQSALHPVIAQLQRMLAWQPEDNAELRLAKLERGLRGYRLPLAETVPLLAALLSLPLPEDGYPALAMSAGQQRRQTQDVLVALWLEASERQPVLSVWEDLHWADPSTLELLGLLIDQTPSASMLHVLTYRPEFEPPWSSRSHLTPITLTPLGRAQTEQVVAQLAAGKALPEEMIDYIVTKTDGVPLYAEELTKMFLSSELLREQTDRYELTGPLLSVTIPDTLQDSLMARLDQLNTAKEIAQLGSVLGRSFSYEMIQPLAAMTEERVQEGLSQLVQADLLYQRGRPPRATYIFKHALIQDAAYISLLRQTRQQLHERIAQLFEAQFPEVVETQPELVAYHYQHGGRTEPAIAHLQRASRQAARRAAYEEAIAHLTTALELLATLPDSLERCRQEMALQLALATPLMVARGYGAAEVEDAFVRARELCEQMDDSSQLAPLLQRGWNLYLVRAQLAKARELGKELLALARHQHDATLCLRAHLALGVTLYYSGLFSPAREHLEEALSLYEPDQHRLHHGLQDPYVTSLGHMAWLRWLLGYPDQARALRTEMLTRARQLDHPNTLAAALTYAAGLSIYLGEVQPVYEWAEETIALCTEHEFALYLVTGLMSQGWALAMQGQSVEGIAQFRKGLSDHQGQGSALDRTGLQGLLAQMYGHAVQPEVGLDVLTEALGQVDVTGERHFEPALYRLKGDLLLQQENPDTSQVEACYQDSLAIARQQEAKSWELSAAIRLGQLWQQQGKCTGARELLSPVYDWFTEGFDTRDLKEAKALLEELKS